MQFSVKKVCSVIYDKAYQESTRVHNAALMCIGAETGHPTMTVTHLAVTQNLISANQSRMMNILHPVMRQLICTARTTMKWTGKPN